MDKLHIRFQVIVSKESGFYYKTTGESNIDIEIPTDALDCLDTRNILMTLLPLAVANLPEENENE